MATTKPIAAKSASRYTFAVWRRKTATASVKLFPNGTGKYIIIKDDKELTLKEYFMWHDHLLYEIMLPFTVIGGDLANKFERKILWSHTSVIFLYTLPKSGIFPIKFSLIAGRCI